MGVCILRIVWGRGVWGRGVWASGRGLKTLGTSTSSDRVFDIFRLVVRESASSFRLKSVSHPPTVFELFGLI